MRRIGSAGLGYAQVFLLFIGFGVASGLIFLFGMWVGRDIAERRLAQEERVVRQAVPVQALPQEEPKQQDADRAFYERLKDKAVQRLESATAVATLSPSRTAASTAASMTPTRTPPWPSGKPTRPTEHALEKPTPRPTAVARAQPTPGKPVVAPVNEEDWADAGWTVQATATTDLKQATALARRLKAKGYDAYTVQAPMRGQTWYRVRVGRFSARERARELEARLKAEEGLDNAYTTPQ